MSEIVIDGHCISLILIITGLILLLIAGVPILSYILGVDLPQNNYVKNIQTSDCIYDKDGVKYCSNIQNVKPEPTYYMKCSNGNDCVRVDKL